MGQEDAYIPYEASTPKELCQDITIKAEKFLKGHKKGMLIIPVICLVLVALGLYFMPNVNWWVGLGFFGLIEVSFIVIYIYTRKLIHEMNLAPNPKQFLPVAQRLKEFVRYSNYFLRIVGLWVSISLMSDFKDLWWWSAASLLAASGLALLVPISEKEAAFYDEVDDLERSLSE